MTHTCEFCPYSTRYKQNLNRHLRAKHPDGENLKPPPSLKWDCKCGKQFQHQSGLSRHKKTCTGEQTVHDVVNTITSGHHNTIHNVYNQNQNNITINITPFSSMTPELTYEDFLRTMNGGTCEALVKLIKDAHFNKQKPEGMNCYISNLKDKIGRVFEEDGWEVCEADDLAFRVFEKYREAIDTIVEEIQSEEMSEESRERLDKVRKRLDGYMKKWEKNSNADEFEKFSVKTIHLLLYNKKDIVREAHNLRF